MGPLASAWWFIRWIFWMFVILWLFIGAISGCVLIVNHYGSKQTSISSDPLSAYSRYAICDPETNPGTVGCHKPVR
jgi:hypothetical protein